MQFHIIGNVGANHHDAALIAPCFRDAVLEATCELAMVQDMLGHLFPETTRIYAKVSNKKMREAHRAAFKYRGGEEE